MNEAPLVLCVSGCVAWPDLNGIFQRVKDDSKRLAQPMYELVYERLSVRGSEYHLACQRRTDLSSARWGFGRGPASKGGDVLARSQEGVLSPWGASNLWEEPSGEALSGWAFAPKMTVVSPTNRAFEVRVNPGSHPCVSQEIPPTEMKRIAEAKSRREQRNPGLNPVDAWPKTPTERRPFFSPVTIHFSETDLAMHILIMSIPSRRTTLESLVSRRRVQIKSYGQRFLVKRIRRTPCADLEFQIRLSRARGWTSETIPWRARQPQCSSMRLQWGKPILLLFLKVWPLRRRGTPNKRQGLY